jgi:hypothetical protein
MPQGLIEDYRASQPSTSTALVRRSGTDTLASQHTRRSFDDDENSSEEIQYRPYKLPGRAQTHPSHVHRSHGSDTREHRSSKRSKDSGSGSFFDRFVDGAKLLFSEYQGLVKDRAEADSMDSLKDVLRRTLEKDGLTSGEWRSTRKGRDRKECDSCIGTSKRRIYSLEKKSGRWHGEWTTRCGTVSRAGITRCIAIVNADIVISA